MRSEPKQLRSSAQWREHFVSNARNSTLLTCTAEVHLSQRERNAILKSIQAFQIGESSEGLHLHRCAAQYASATGDSAYLEAIKLFIKEEQRHAQYLARFMSLAGIPLTRRIFIDQVFRKLRNLSGLECSIAVLITAEIIAQVFYCALRDATTSEFLKAICIQILQDEEWHVEFQAERLALLRKDRKPGRAKMTNLLQRCLFLGTVPVVWIKCRETVGAGGYTFRRFFSDCWQHLNIAMTLMNFGNYHTAEELAVAHQA